MSSFEEFKNRYNEGYRCIYKEKHGEEGLTVHLKNFFTEKIDTFNTKNAMEIGQIEDFLDKLEKVKKCQGHDCHNL